MRKPRCAVSTPWALANRRVAEPSRKPRCAGQRRGPPSLQSHARSAQRGSSQLPASPHGRVLAARPIRRRQLDDTPARLNVLRGICFFFLARGRLLVAHELAVQFASLGARGEEAEGHAGTMLATCTFSLGRQREALEHAQRSVALGDGWAQTAAEAERWPLTAASARLHAGQIGVHASGPYGQ